jgi:hypothetical protein
MQTLSFLLPIIIALADGACGESCSQCWLNNDTNFCYQCSQGYVWENKQCVIFDEAFQKRVPAFGRQCAECGQGNYWSDNQKTCVACKYQSAFCLYASPCCNDTLDIKCTPTFTLINDQCQCERGSNFIFQNECICPDENTYTDGNGECIQCKDKCKIGCENYECQTGTYLNGCKCTPIHYSCDTADGPYETSCLTCADGFESVLIDSYHYCLCDCCSIEIDHECLPINEKDNTSICKLCPKYQYYNGQVCQCIEKEKIIFYGICQERYSIICPNDTRYSNGVCECNSKDNLLFGNICIGSAECIFKRGIINGTQCVCPSYLVNQEGCCQCEFPEVELDFGGKCQAATNDSCKAYDSTLILTKDPDDRWMCALPKNDE